MSTTPRADSTRSNQQQQPDDRRHHASSSCIFCRIARGEIKPGRRDNPQELLYESDNVCAFADIAPAADFHVLIIPKVHYRTCWELTTTTSTTTLPAVILQEMNQVAQKLLDEHYQKQAKPVSTNGNDLAPQRRTLQFFSRPPFYSVAHVHLHVMTRPLTKFQWWNPLHYHYYMPALQVTPQELQAHLEKKNNEKEEAF